MNFYEALNLRTDATVEEIEEAYRRLARRVHPDVSPNDLPRAEARMKLLNQIKDTLTDPQKRAVYDAELQESTSQSSKSQSLQGNTTVLVRKRVSGWKLGALAVGALAIGFFVANIIFVHHGEKIPVASDNQESRTNEDLHNPSNSNILTPQTSHENKSSKKAQARIDSRPAPGAKAKVVQVGSTVREVMELLGTPDRVEEFPANRTRILYYGKLRLLIQDGKVAQGAIKG